MALDVDDDFSPEEQEKWCAERRAEVLAYLDLEGLNHGPVAPYPAWHVQPYITVWAIESLKAPGRVGWWAICGDLPTDYCSAGAIKTPRQAVAHFSRLWGEVAESMERGESHPELVIGTPKDWPMLAPLLKARSQILAGFCADDDNWDEE